MPVYRLVFVLGSLWLSGVSLAAVNGYYSEPALGPDRLVFVSESDLWMVSRQGGVARRLTAHAEPKGHPALSPDGSLLAFTGRYGGGSDVYVMPSTGGVPRRLSFENANVSVEGWTPDGEVVYATNGLAAPASFRVLRTVHPETLARRELPLMDARQAAFAEDGTLYFTRFGLAVTGDNAREYRGGAMAQLWRFHPDRDDEAERLAADHPGNLEHPMWWQGQIYALSDADGGTANLWRLDADGANPVQLTFHEAFEARGASLSEGRIVYQQGADLRLFDIATGTDRKLDITLASDRSQVTTRWLDQPLDYLDAARFAPGGDRVVLTARGQVAIAGTGALRRIEIELPQDSRARRAVLGPDGDWLYAIVDATGEHEIWRFPAAGDGPGEALTDDGSNQRENLVISPDGRHLAHSDRAGVLWLLDTRSGRNRQIDTSDGFGHSDIVWSPNSDVLALIRPDSAVSRRQLLLYHLADERLQVLSSDRYESYSPAFSPDGRWLYFLSDRSFQPNPSSPWGDRNLGAMLDRRTRIYAYSLQPDNPFPLAPKTELTPKPDGDNDNDNDNEPPAIDFNGLQDRLFEVAVDAGNYSALAVAGSRLFVLDSPSARGSEPALRTIDFSTDRPSLETFADGVGEYELSADRSKLFYRSAGNGDMYIVDAGASTPGDLGPARVRVGDWRLAVEPDTEWRQMFGDAWRMQRDYLFDPAMRGQDWVAIGERYAPLIERIGDRRELDDLLSQMVAELGVLHSQVRGGDYRSQSEIAAPSYLGGEFEPVEQGLRISRIYRSDPELPSERSPLVRPGVRLQVDDVITRVNGRAVASLAELDRALIHQSGQQVRLDVLRDEAPDAVIVEPIDSSEEYFLRYRDWVTAHRERVERESAGRIGYLHLHAMGPNDLADFAREFYANYDREGLIIDVRRNRGGNIDSWVIEKLLRRAWMFWYRPGEQPFWNMQQTFRGHLAVLIDELTYSDGETFAAGVKSLGLGPLIGTRSTGAGVWLSDTNRLVDRGVMRAAQWPQFSPDGSWLVEGQGVAPDIEVENLPHATWRGRDAQLTRALEELTRKLREQP